jgi:hypothetical protein
MPVSGRKWIAALPAELDGQRRLLAGLLDCSEADRRIRWLALGCSLSRGAGDRLSDLDAALGVSDADFDAALPAVRCAVDGLGDLVDSYQHQLPGLVSAHERIFAQYADRCQVDLVVLPASAASRLPPRTVVLYDPDDLVGVSAGAGPVSPQQVREWAFSGWCALADLGKYLRRGSAWEALGRLGEARAWLCQLHAAALGVPDPQYGLTSILDFAPDRLPDGLAATVSGLAPVDLLAGALQTAAMLAEAGRGLTAEQRAALPSAMARYVTSDLAALRQDGRRPGKAADAWPRR